MATANVTTVGKRILHRTHDAPITLYNSSLTVVVYVSDESPSNTEGLPLNPGAQMIWTPADCYAVTSAGAAVVIISKSQGRLSDPNVITGPVTISGTVTVTGTVGISGTVTVTGAVTVTGTVAISGSVAVTGTVSISGSVAVTGTVAISGTVAVSGSVTVSGTVAISGTVAVSGTVAISGTVTVSGSVTVSGTVAISGTVTVTGAVTISGPVTISGAVTITGNVTLNTSPVYLVDNPLLLLSIAAAANPIAGGPIDISSYQSVIIAFFRGAVGGDNLIVTWQDVAGNTISVDRFSFRSGALGSANSIHLPCRGAKVTVATTSGTSTTSLSLHGSQRMLTSPRYQIAPDQWGGSGVGTVSGIGTDNFSEWSPGAVAATITATESPPVKSGLATLVIDVTAVTGAVNSVLLLDSISLAPIAGLRAVSATGLFIQEIVIPRRAVLMRIICGAASGITCTMALSYNDQ